MSNIVSNKINCPECERQSHIVDQKDCPECLRYAHQGTHKEYTKDCPDCIKYAQHDPKIAVIPDGNKDAHKKVFPDTHHNTTSMHPEGHHHGIIGENVVPGTHHEKVVDKHDVKHDKHHDKVVVVDDKHDKHDKHIVDKHDKHDKHHDKVVVDDKHDKHGKHHETVVVTDKHDQVHVDKHGKVEKDKHNDVYRETPDTQHGIKPDKDAGSRKVIPTPHDNKEVPGRHHEKVHPEHYDTKKAHPDLKHDTHGALVDSHGRVIESHHQTVVQEAPRDIINEVHADAHHTTYGQKTGVTGGSILGLTAVRQDYEVIKANTEKLLAMDAFSAHDRDAKQRLLNDTIALISQHNVASEVVLYRAIKKLDKNKSKVARNQTIEVEKLLYDIDQDYGTQVDKPHFYDRFKALDTLLMKHITDDEREIISVLEHHYTAENLDSLNSWFDKIKKLSPTRPHPDGPHSTAAKLAAGPALAFVDQMRDGGKKFTK